MAFDIVTFSDSVKNLIHKNNTTSSSYDVSGSLTTRVNKITVGYHKNKPIPIVDYPCIWVEPLNSSNEFAVVGRNALRDITVAYNIVAMTGIGMGYTDGREKSDREMLSLSANIEELFRNYPHLSVTSQVMSSLITESEYDVSEYNDTYISMANLKLEVKIKST